MNSFSLKQVDWKLHWLRLSFLLAATIYLIFAIVVRYYYQKNHTLVEQQVQQQRAINQSSANSLAVFKANYPVYQSYAEKNQIGSANRLNWVATLDAIARQIGVPDVHFSLDNTRVSLEGESPFFHYDIPIYSTDMHMDLKLLHEGDLYKLLTSYERQSKGTFSVESCEIARNGNSSKETHYEGLRAKCKLRWYNVKDFRESWGEDISDATI